MSGMKKKITVKIAQADFSKPSDLKAVNDIFRLSHETLSPHAVTAVFQFVTAQWYFWVLMFGVSGIVWYLSSSVTMMVLIDALLVGGLAAFTYHTTASGFAAMAERIATQLDLAPGTAARVYNAQPPTSACFIALVDSQVSGTGTGGGSSAVASPAPVIVGNACVMTGDDANRFKHPELLPFAPHEALITRVGVLPRYHGAGIGACMVDAAIKWAAARGCTRLRLLTTSAQPAAIAMYTRRFGFNLHKRTWLFPLFGFAMLEYVCDLSPSSTPPVSASSTPTAAA